MWYPAVSPTNISIHRQGQLKPRPQLACLERGGGGATGTCPAWGIIHAMVRFFKGNTSIRRACWVFDSSWRKALSFGQSSVTSGGWRQNKLWILNKTWGPLSTVNTANVLLNVCSACSTERLLAEYIRWTEANDKSGCFSLRKTTLLLPRLWAITEELEDIGDTWPFADQWSFSRQTVCCCKQKTKRSLYWTELWWSPRLWVNLKLRESRNLS